MTEYDEKKVYAKQEDVYFNDGREIEVLHHIYNKANIDEIRDSPEKVLAAIDEYARNHKYLMNVGDDKGKIVCDVIAEAKPETMVCCLFMLLRLTTMLITYAGGARRIRWLFHNIIRKCHASEWREILLQPRK